MLLITALICLSGVAALNVDHPSFPNLHKEVNAHKASHKVNAAELISAAVGVGAVGVGAVGVGAFGTMVSDSVTHEPKNEPGLTLAGSQLVEAAKSMCAAVPIVTDGPTLVPNIFRITISQNKTDHQSITNLTSSFSGAGPVLSTTLLDALSLLDEDEFLWDSLICQAGAAQYLEVSCYSNMTTTKINTFILIDTQKKYFQAERDGFSPVTDVWTHMLDFVTKCYDFSY